MKRWIILLLCLALPLSGCTAALAPEQTQESYHTHPQQEETSAPVETVPPLVYSKPLTAISMIPYSETVRHSAGATLYSWSSQNINLVMNDLGVAEAITLDFANRDDRIMNAVITDLAAANTDYTGMEDWIPYFCEIRYSPARLDQITLSLVGHERLYDGTHRSGESTFAYNYDMQTGIALSLRDVLDPGFSADALVTYITEALADKTEYLYEDYTDSISALFASNAPVENWYFTDIGLTFFFNPYEIAPQSQGVILVEVPYTLLTGILKDSYFPEESVAFSGNLLMGSLDTVAEPFYRYVEAVMDNSGTPYLIYPQGTVQNVRVESGSWSKNGTFVPENTLFFAEALTENTALELLILPEHLGKLCITYQSGDNIIQTPWQSN